MAEKITKRRNKKQAAKAKKMTKAEAPKSGVPKAPIPVTLLSGFLGSGKTTLVKHLLGTNHGYRIALIVNDIGEKNIDAAWIKKMHTVSQTQKKVVELQNGCICCTLRGDLLEELVRLAELQQFDYVVIESSGISEPEQVAETFDARLADHLRVLGDQPAGEGLDEGMLKLLKRLQETGGLEKFAKLDTTVTVIDAFTMFHDFDTADFLSNRRDDVAPEDERTVSDLMVDQIEFADVIVLNKISTVTPETRASILELVKKLNPRAKILQTDYSKIDVKEILNTGRFNMDAAQTGYGWLKDLHDMTLQEINGKKTVTPKPETEEYSVRNFVYQNTRPFHPRRLFALVYDKFIMQAPEEEEEEEDDEDETEDEMQVDTDVKKRAANNKSTDKMHVDSDSDQWEGLSDHPASDSTAPTTPELKASNDDSDLPALDIPSDEAILATKRASPLFARLFRSKGEYFLATRPHRAGTWSQAGAMLTLEAGRPWFCTNPEAYGLSGDAEIEAMMKHDLAKGGEWGDRRQELVFIGEKLDVQGLTAALDACVLDNEEFKQWEECMRKGKTDEERKELLLEVFEDGFPDGGWFEEEQVGHEGHVH